MCERGLSQVTARTYAPSLHHLQDCYLTRSPENQVPSTNNAEQASS